MLALAAISFGLAWWLGLYLLARDLRKPLLRRVGGGLVLYAVALVCDLLRPGASGALALALGRLHLLLVFVPAICWTGATILLLPESQLRARLDSIWRWVLAPLTLADLLGASLLGILDQPDRVGTTYSGLAALVLLPLLAMLVLLVIKRRQLQPASAGGLLIAATLFFGLGAALLLFPLGLIGREWMALGIGIDLVLLGLATAISDAFEEGERLRYDLLRSLISAGGAALLFGGQIGLALLIGASAAPLTALLFGSIAAAIAIQVLAGPLQAALDRLAFQGEPALQEARAELQATAEALPRLSPPSELEALDPAEFARLTRRALSHYSDLARLATSPLTQLPAIGTRLAARAAPDNPLTRAAELKQLLAESIAHLKPHGSDFGTSDEWRHYNALYFPYVIGLRPYSRRADRHGLDHTAQRALEWLASQVPERTLYNWQNSAARLVAAHLQSNMAVLGSDSGSIRHGDGSGKERILSLRNTPPT